MSQLTVASKSFVCIKNKLSIHRSIDWYCLKCFIISSVLIFLPNSLLSNNRICSFWLFRFRCSFFQSTHPVFIYAWLRSALMCFDCFARSTNRIYFSWLFSYVNWLAFISFSVVFSPFLHSIYHAVVLLWIIYSFGVSILCLLVCLFIIPYFVGFLCFTFILFHFIFFLRSLTTFESPWIWKLCSKTVATKKKKQTTRRVFFYSLCVVSKFSPNIPMKAKKFCFFLRHFFSLEFDSFLFDTLKSQGINNSNNLRYTNQLKWKEIVSSSKIFN